MKLLEPLRQIDAHELALRDSIGIDRYREIEARNPNAEGTTRVSKRTTRTELVELHALIRALDEAL